MEQFVKLLKPSNARLLLLNYAKIPSVNWFHKNAFDILPVPLELLDDTMLKMKLKFNSSPVIFRMQPWQFYRFHIDAARGCAINLFLDGADSETYYGDETPDEEILNITELKYEIDHYYLLNTKIKHCVINRNNIRYMFSMGFPLPLLFDDVKEFCYQNGII